MSASTHAAAAAHALAAPPAAPAFGANHASSSNSSSSNSSRARAHAADADIVMSSPPTSSGSLANSSLSAGPSAGPSSPLLSLSAMVLYAEADYGDLTVTVTECDSLLLATPFKLLSCNSELLAPLIHQSGTQPKVEFVLDELSLPLLHLLSALHDQLLTRPGSSLVVTMLTRQGLRDEVRQREQPSDSAASVLSSASDPKPTSTAAGDAPLLFSADAQGSPLRLRWCSSWSDAINVAAPTRAVYLPSLMWLSEDCSPEQAHRHVSAMLDEIGATLWPPTSWEALVEHKDKIYSRFNKFMLPACWVSLSAVGGCVERLAASLLGFCSQQGRGDGRYFVKGSLSCAKMCGECITVADRRCAELVDVLRKFISKEHQQGAGIQSFMPGFDLFELRTWLVLDQVTGRWRSSLTLKTQLTEDGIIAELYQPIHGAGLRIAQLIDDMLLERADFFDELRSLGVPALRVDCGYDQAAQRAFFSEFAVSDAYMWTQLHNQDLAAVVGRAMGDAMWMRMLEGR